MFRNYLISGWKVLLRRKTFTFISLFGIAITLAVLLVLTTLLDNSLNPMGPEKNNENLLYIQSLKVVSEDRKSNWNASLGYKFLVTNVTNLKIPEVISIFTKYSSGASYLNGDKITNKLRRTDLNYWKILDFKFLHGRHFDQQEFESGAMVTIINETTQRELFPNLENSVGEYLTVNNQRFEIIGIVEDVSFIETVAFSDIWVPYTTYPSTSYKEVLVGDWNALLYHSNLNRIPQMQQEYVTQLENDFVTPDPERFRYAYSGADTIFEAFARQFTNSTEYDSGLAELISIFITLAVCLPPLGGGLVYSLVGWYWLKLKLAVFYSPLS